MIKNYIYKFSIIFVLSLIFGGLNIAILAYINKFILNLTEPNLKIMLFFAALILFFFIATFFIRVVITKINNIIIYELRVKFVLKVLNTKMIFDENKPKILASLSKDIGSISNGFMRLSDAVQGFVLVILSLAYFYYLSKEMFLFVFLWFGLIFVLTYIFIGKARSSYASSRKFDDDLYKSYETLLGGFRELRISKKREDSFLATFFQEATSQKNANIKAEIYGNLSSNFLNVMMLFGIGFIMFLSLGLGVSDFKTATTISLSMMFLRAPFMMAVSSIPSILVALISIKKIKELKFDEIKESFGNKTAMKWNRLFLKDIDFAYLDKKILNGLSLTIKKDKIIFLVGKNGSGKSTLFSILCGLLTPQRGEIWIDEKRLCDEDLRAFQNSIAVVFSDFFLFGEILNCDESFIDFWLEKLKLKDKFNLNLEKNSFKFSSFNLSTGQKKRLALLEVLALEKDFLMLDEFGADQDPEFREYFYKEILPFLKNKGVGIFAISHDDRYFKFADEIYKMSDGKALQIKWVPRPPKFLKLIFQS